MIVRSKQAFTLVELLLAAVMGAVIVLVALAAYRGVVESRRLLLYNSQVNSHARYLLNHLRQDMANFYRSDQPGRMLITGIKAGAGRRQTDRLKFYAVSDKKVRSAGKESDIYEIEYGLSFSERLNEYYAGRRCGAVRDLKKGNQGGKLVQTARFVDSLTFEFYDGLTWRRGWVNSDVIPSLVRVTMIMRDPVGVRADITISQEIATGLTPKIKTDEVDKSDEKENDTDAKNK